MAKPGDLSRGQLLGLVLPVLLVLAFAAALALQALDATRSHRETVRHTLNDYAEFAAQIVASGAWQEMERRLLYAFAPIRLWRAGDSIPQPSELGRDPAERRRCAVTGDSLPIFARLTLPDGPLDVAGRAPEAETHRWLADTLPAVAAGEPESENRFGHIIRPHVRDGIWAYVLLRDSTGHAMAIYAKTSCLSSDGISIFRRALGERPALPPSATRGLSNDSLLVVLVEDARGNVLWRSDSTTYSTMVTSGAVESPRLGNARIRAEIRPAAAESLVIGGVPASRLPVALLLLLLATGFAAFAIAQIRRQQMLIRTRERFVANVSHELRTPLQQILVFTELLRMGKVRNEGERQHSLEVIERETHRLILLVDNVLRFSRIDRSGAGPVSDTVDVAALARETVQTFDPLARTSDANVILDAEPAHALGDADSIRRVLLNLLDNAAKYGPRGQEIRVVVRQRGDRTIVSVEDEGPGVPEAERAGIWEPFRRLERDEAGSIAGSGMGLAIVSDLVRRMGGDVWMDERSNGARFTFDLPAAVADMSSAGGRTMSPAAASRTGETNPE